MGDLFWNKIFGAFLAVALGIFALRELGHALIHSHEPAKPGYAVALDEAPSAAKPAEEVKEVSLAEMLAGASASSGERVAKKCAACHDLTKGGPNKTGPNLWGVVGRTAASHAGFKYSQAMTDFGGDWTFENLNTFLTSPKGFVKGTAMSFAGLKKAKDRANLIAYLRTLSDDPLPLPAIAAQAADAAADAVDTASAAADTVVDAAGDSLEKAADTAKDTVLDAAKAVADEAKDKAEEALATPDKP